MRFASPWALLILLMIPLLIWMRRHQREAGAIRFSSITHAAQAGRLLRQKLSFIPAGARLLALVLLVLGLARPQKGLDQVWDIKKGIAIEMVLDRSGSMGAEMEFRGQRLNRLEVVKRVFAPFVLGNGQDLKGRPNDLVGIVVYARYPDTICPLTLAHGALPKFLETVHVVRPMEGKENGTAIGDAIALAAARLKNAEETLARQSQRSREIYQIKSKVMILLTDGQNNSGKRDPVQAARLAAQWGIKIYTVGVGGRETVPAAPPPFGIFPQMPAGQPVDERALKAIAEATGGVCRMAEDAEALQSIYREIDRLERSEIQVMRYRDYKELFTPLALAALLLVSVETVLNGTVFRKIP